MATFQTLEKTIYVIAYLIKKLFSKFEMWPFTSIWLEISVNWHTTSQGPKKKCTLFQEGESTTAPPKPPVIRVVLLYAERFVQSFNVPTVPI